jgi:hypothetical protein
MRYLDDAWRYELVRLNESESTWLNDTLANREVVQQTDNRLPQLWRRAQLLAPGLGAVTTMQNVTSTLKASAMILGLLAIVLGLSAGLAALGDSAEPVNVIWALLAVLLVPTLSLLLWIVSCLLPQAKGGWLGQGWEWVANRWLSRGKAARAWRAWLNVAEERQATKWWLAVVTHSFWVATLAGALLALLVAFSLRHYTFMWQTTWLEAAVFVELAQAISVFPAWLGFNVPEAQTILMSGNQAVDQSTIRTQWAHWLVGAVFAWGLLPRLIALIVSAYFLQRCYASVQPQPKDAYALLVQERLQKALKAISVDGPPGQLDQWPQAVFLSPKKCRDTRAAVALETAWLEARRASLTDAVHVLAPIDDRVSRQEALVQLQSLAPSHLLIVVDAQQTPDRGLLNTILALTPHTGRARVYLKPANGARNRTVQWQDKLQAIGLGKPLLDWPSALEWMKLHD